MNFSDTMKCREGLYINLHFESIILRFDQEMGEKLATV